LTLQFVLGAAFHADFPTLRLYRTIVFYDGNALPKGVWADPRPNLRQYLKPRKAFISSGLIWAWARRAILFGLPAGRTATRPRACLGAFPIAKTIKSKKQQFRPQNWFPIRPIICKACKKQPQ